MKHVILITMLLIPFSANAQEIFPKGCAPYAIHGEYATLSVEKPTVVMFHNLAHTKIWLTRHHALAGAQAGWSSEISPGKWSALVLEPHRHAFQFACIESQPGHEQPVSCQEVLAVCQWPKTHLPNDQSGTFWAGENMTMQALTAYLQRMGFQLN